MFYRAFCRILVLASILSVASSFTAPIKIIEHMSKQVHDGVQKIVAKKNDMDHKLSEKSREAFNDFEELLEHQDSSTLPGAISNMIKSFHEDLDSLEDHGQELMTTFAESIIRYKYGYPIIDNRNGVVIKVFPSGASDVITEMCKLYSETTCDYLHDLAVQLQSHVVSTANAAVASGSSTSSQHVTPLSTSPVSDDASYSTTTLNILKMLVQGTGSGLHFEILYSVENKRGGSLLYSAVQVVSDAVQVVSDEN